MERIKPLHIDTNTVNIWFTSDTHFGHKNIINFCERPFRDIDEMDEAIITKWNNKVGKDDIVFHLGDFAFSSNKRWQELIYRLNGKIYLILGNHDITRWPGTYTMEQFDRVENQMLLKIDNKYKVYLNHFPFLCYDGTYRNYKDCTIQLHGHVHERTGDTGKDAQRIKYRFPYQYDVGVDNNNFEPISWKEILTKLNYL